MSIADSTYADFSEESFEPFNKCIYCGSTDDLTDEHIIPFALHGNTILPKSSCKECASKTGKVEQDVLRGPMSNLRKFKKLQSRSKHGSVPDKINLKVIRNDKEETIQVSLEDYPIIVNFPLFTKPALLKPEGYTNGIRLKKVIALAFGDDFHKIKKRLEIDDFVINQKYKMVSFGRMVAKIAYSYSVAKGLIKIGNHLPEIASSIIGKTDDIGKYVGTLEDPLKKEAGYLHKIGFHTDNEIDLNYASVKLFANELTPYYGVILNFNNLT